MSNCCLRTAVCAYIAAMGSKGSASEYYYYYSTHSGSASNFSPGDKVVLNVQVYSVKKMKLREVP